MTETKKLYRDTQDAWIGGVGSGLAEYFGVDKTAIRVGIALLVVFTGLFPGVVAYVVMWIIIPAKPLFAPSVPLAPSQP